MGLYAGVFLITSAELQVEKGMAVGSNEIKKRELRLLLNAGRINNKTS